MNEGAAINAALVAQESVNQYATIHASAQRVSDTADHLQRVLRGMLNRLRPTGLDDLGLVSSLQLLVEGWQLRHGIACSFSASGSLDGLDESVTITLYRSVQESLTNIARHARASQASVAIVRVAQEAGEGEGEGHISLTVCDNGVGLQFAAAQPGLGILGMRERVSALGGQLELTRLPSGGTQLQVLLPLVCTKVAA